MQKVEPSWGLGFDLILVETGDIRRSQLAWKRKPSVFSKSLGAVSLSTDYVSS